MAIDPQTPTILLSAQLASRDQRLSALGAMLLMSVVVIAAIPFGRVAGPPVPGFILVLHTILAVNDLMTAALLVGQYLLQPTRNLNILAGGYLFTALITVPYLLSFHGALPETAFLSIGPNSAPWLYLVWRAGLAVAVIVYAFHSAGPNEEKRNGSASVAVLGTILIVTAVAAMLGILGIAGHDWLPDVGEGNPPRFTAAAKVGIAATFLLTAVGLILLGRRRPYKVLDLWLLVAMFAWLFSIILGEATSSFRYEVGYDVSRLLAVLASTFVLIVLLLEVNVLYARTVRDRERHLQETESILVHLSRVNDLGQNVSSLIHEVNQPLAAINNYLQAGMTLIATGRTDRLQPILELLAGQVERATEIIRHLRDFIARRESEKRTENVSEVLQNATRLALASFNGPPPTIELTCTPAATSAFFDRIQIEQVALNLVLNAAEAMIDSGRRSIIVATELNADNMVEVHIADSGPGLSPEIRDRLFQPFVTTKESGLGIGLSICRVIIEAHGGRLWAEDNPAGGTIFRFTIPCSPITIPSSRVPA